MVVERYYYKWKKVKNAPRQEQRVCSRCGNAVSYDLVWDGTGIGLVSESFMWFHTKYFAYKCPICPQYEMISKEKAKRIMGKI